MEVDWSVLDTRPESLLPLTELKERCPVPYADIAATVDEQSGFPATILVIGLMGGPNLSAQQMAILLSVVETASLSLHAMLSTICQEVRRLLQWPTGSTELQRVLIDCHIVITLI